MTKAPLAGAFSIAAPLAEAFSIAAPFAEAVVIAAPLVGAFVFGQQPTVAPSPAPQSAFALGVPPR